MSNRPDRHLLVSLINQRDRYLAEIDRVKTRIKKKKNHLLGIEKFNDNLIKMMEGAGLDRAGIAEALQSTTEKSGKYQHEIAADKIYLSGLRKTITTLNNRIAVSKNVVLGKGKYLRLFI